MRIYDQIRAEIDRGISPPVMPSLQMDMDMDQSGRGRQRASIADLTPEQKESLLSQLGSAVVPMLTYLGETLDKPGRATRGLISAAAGGPAGGGLLNLIPFSDTWGWTDPAEAVSGRDLLEMGNLVRPDQPGFDPGDVAGLAAEFILDPSRLITGPLSSVVGGAKAFAKGSRIGTSIPKMAREIESGTRSLFSIRAPFSKDPLFMVGKGKWAAKQFERAFYNPVSRGIRQLLDERVDSRAGILLQKHADETHGQIFDELANYKEVLTEVHSKLPKIGEAWDSIKAHYPFFNGMGWEDVLRTVGEEGSGNYLQRIANGMNASQPFVEQAKMIDDTASKLSGLMSTAWQEINGLGGNIGQLDDLIKYWPRRPSRLIRSLLNEKPSERLTSFPFARARKDPYRGVYTQLIKQITMDPLVTATGDVTPAGLKAAATRLETVYGIPKFYNLTGKRVKYSAKHGKKIDTYAQSYHLARAIAGLPKEVLEKGLFDRTSILDAMDYLETAARYKGTLAAMHEMLHSVADDAAKSGPTVADFWEKLGLKNDGLLKWEADHAARVGTAVKATQARVPQEMLDSAGRFMRYHMEPEQAISTMGKVYDELMGLYKGGLTLTVPSFYTRNGISGFWQNMVTAFRNPIHAIRAYIQVAKALHGDDEAFLAAMKAHDVIPHGGTFADEVLGESSRLSVIPSAPYANVMDPRIPVRRAKENYQAGVATAQAAGAGLLGRMKGGVSTLYSGQTNRLGERTVGGLFQWGRDANLLVEIYNRGAHFAARLADGWDPALAAKSVEAAHFNYSKLTPFEKKYAKRLVTFYTFSRKNLPAQLRNLIDAPGGRTAQTVRLMSGIRREGAGKESESGTFIPPWLGESAAFKIPGGTPSNTTFVSESGLLPISEAITRFPMKNNLPYMSQVGENIAAMMTPAFTAPMQRIANRQFWSHRSLDDLYREPFSDPLANYWLYQSPLARLAATGRMLSDPRKSGTMKLVNALVGGIRVSNVDVQKAINLHLRDIIEDDLSNEAGIGHFTKLYPQDLSKMNERARAEYALLVMLARDYKAIKEQEERGQR